MAFKWKEEEQPTMTKKEAKQAAKAAKKAEKEAKKAAKKAAKEAKKNPPAPVKEEPVKAEPVKAEPAKASAAAPKATAPKTATRSTATKTATAAKSTATKSTATKTAADKSRTTTAAKSQAPAVKASAPKKAPAKAPAKTTEDGVPVVATARPFFMPTDEEVRAAFDEAIAQADAQIAKNGTKAVGKYEFSLEVDGFHFYLIANNGQILFESPSFASLLGALNGIQTFKKAVTGGEFKVKVDKYDRYRFILERKYFSENYTSKDQCQKCVDSVKNFANNARIIFFTPDKAELETFEKAKNAKRKPDDIDWKAVAEAEKKATKMGKFEISEEDGDYCFYLLANNGQILYASRYYASEAACRKGVESFKRAAYVGNFFVDRDKFGNYRYVLKNIGSAPAFIGESYDNKPQCEKIIDSVKKFIVSATIEIDK